MSGRFTPEKKARPQLTHLECEAAIEAIRAGVGAGVYGDEPEKHKAALRALRKLGAELVRVRGAKAGRLP